MASTNDDPRPDPDRPEEPDDQHEANAVADDGMAPMITNTGADETEGDDADAPSG